MYHKIPIQNKWIVWSDDDMAKGLVCSDANKANQWRVLGEEFAIYQKNPLSYFLPHGEGLDFINDRSSSLKGLIAGNQDGKTYHGLAWLGMQCIQMYPTWECVQHHGVRQVEWTGSKRVAIASYKWSHIRLKIYPSILELWPYRILGPYSPKWFQYPDDNGKMRKGKLQKPDWGSGSPQLELQNGSTVDLFSYSQDMESPESMTYDFIMLDEQPPEEWHDAFFARGITKMLFQIAVCYSPHKIKERKDTGGGSWLDQVRCGTSSKKIRSKFYRIKKDDVPGAIQHPLSKKKAYEMFIEGPTLAKDLKRLRHGRARYYGETEYTEGLVYDNVFPGIHFIDPIPLRRHWSRYRAVDPGSQMPTACVFACVTEWGDVLLFDEYYESGQGVEKDVLGIMAKSGNSRRAVDWITLNESTQMRQYEEEQRTRFEWTVMDPRAFKAGTGFQGINLAALYGYHGLACIQGSGMRNIEAIPICKSWFDIDKDRTHILVRLGLKSEIKVDGMTIEGAPKCYVFNTMKFFIKELFGYVTKQGTDKPVEKEDHAMTAFKYLVLSNPRYVGLEEQETLETEATNPHFEYAVE